MAEPQQSPQTLQLEQQHGHQGQIRQTFDNQLVLEYLDLAEALAARFQARGRDRADLNQVAYLGLVKAARGFEAGRGTSFAASAAPTITGELKRYLRDRCWVVRPPRHLQDLRSELLRAEPVLAQALGHPPTAAELAVELDGVPGRGSGGDGGSALQLLPQIAFPATAGCHKLRLHAPRPPPLGRWTPRAGRARASSPRAGPDGRRGDWPRCRTSPGAPSTVPVRVSAPPTAALRRPRRGQSSAAPRRLPAATCFRARGRAG